MLVSQTLKYARVLLASGWCQGAEARDEWGEPVEPWDVMAVSWSLPGALAAVARDCGDEDGELERHALTALAFVLEVPAETLAEWNDEPARTQADATAACQCALELVPQLVARHMPAAGDR